MLYLYGDTSADLIKAKVKHTLCNLQVIANHLSTVNSQRTFTVELFQAILNILTQLCDVLESVFMYCLLLDLFTLISVSTLQLQPQLT